MSFEKYEMARRLIIESGAGDFDGAKQESLIRSAEMALETVFPPSYRHFLMDFGCGAIYGLEIFGLIDANFEKSSVPNGIWLTLNERRSLNIKPSYVIVGDGGDGTYLALDTARLDVNGENPVVRLALDGSYSELIAQSFGEYLLSEINRRAP
jgi:hypothetical protein